MITQTVSKQDLWIATIVLHSLFQLWRRYKFHLNGFVHRQINIIRRILTDREKWFKASFLLFWVNEILGIKITHIKLIHFNFFIAFSMCYFIAARACVSYCLAKRMECKTSNRSCIYKSYGAICYNSSYVYSIGMLHRTRMHRCNAINAKISSNRQ